MKSLIVTISLICFVGISEAQNPKLEIYLLKKRVSQVESKGWNSHITRHFTATNSDIQDSAFITDSEILNYDSSKPALKVTPSATLKISKLEPSISEGIQFVLTIDKEPVLNGYFINKYTSSPLLSYMIMNRIDSIYHIDRVMPEIKTDDRKNPALANAFLSTGRLQ